MMRWGIWIASTLVVLITAGWFIVQNPNGFASAPEKWSQFVEPGKLSKFHANLENSCNECHGPYRGVERDQCVVCHAAQTEVLKKQNTAFHSSVSSCTGCHFEHQGRDASITQMDHTHLALVASEMVRKAAFNKGSAEVEAPSTGQVARKGYHGADTTLEKTLNCVGCHANQDKHRSLFGSDCSSCHDTAKWTITSFRHPMPTSRDCSQCHTAPPSHYMMHFEMVSKKVASQGAMPNSGCCSKVQVSQCYACHQITSWNDIKGVGWYKHH